MQTDFDKQQGTESPEEDAEEMLADDVVPKMLLDDVLARGGDEIDHQQADDGEKDIHPTFVKDVEMRFVVMFFVCSRLN